MKGGANYNINTWQPTKNIIYCLRSRFRLIETPVNKDNSLIGTIIQLQ
jgi:hypothetical protein